MWRVVHIPSVEAEDERHLHRTLMTLDADRTRHLNRLKGMLMAQGVSLSVSNGFQEELQDLRLWDGSPIRGGLQARIKREYALLKVVEEHIREVEAERREALRHSTTASVAQVRQLLRLRGIGENSAWLYVMELFGWRQFRNLSWLKTLSVAVYVTLGSSSGQPVIMVQPIQYRERDNLRFPLCLQN